MHTRGIGHLPGKGINVLHNLVVDTTIVNRFDDNVEHIDTNREVLGDRFAVRIVARRRTQLRHSLVQVANLDLASTHGAEDHQPCSKDDQRSSRPGLCGSRHAHPETIHFLDTFAQALFVVFRETDVGKQDRQQHKIGENNRRHPETGGNRHLLDHFDVDQHDGNKADGV